MNSANVVAYRVTPSRIHVLRASAVNINQYQGDVARFTSLPAKWRLRRVSAFDASVTLAGSPASIGLYTASFQAGTNLVAVTTLTSLTAAAKMADLTLAAINNTDYQTASEIFVWNHVRHGSAATITLEIELENMA